MNLKLKKGLDLNLAGAVNSLIAEAKCPAAAFAITPDDFPGFTPKLEVKEGDSVAAGQPLLRHKDCEQLKITSPAAGVVKAIVRGARRKIERVVIEASGDASADFGARMPASASEAIELLCASGMLARMRQRPYDIVPNPAVEPRDVFVTAIDSAPLSPGFGPMLAPAATLAKGVAVLRMVTKGKVYISVPEGWTLGPIDGAEMATVQGKHPAGNVGVQIANIAPVNKGETVWGLDVVTLGKIGALVETGRVDGSTVVAITGSEVTSPCMVETTEGAALEPLLKGRIAQSGRHVRIISGNVLTGTAEPLDSYLRFPYRQVTVIPEGDDANEFMGWASMSPSKMSASRAFPLSFMSKAFKPDARLLGGRRAMIMSGEYDKYMPMDIMPEYLIKAILARDIEGMEKLGIYEVAPEDFALAEWADTSKLPLQQIVRDGLDFLRKELS